MFLCMSSNPFHQLKPMNKEVEEGGRGGDKVRDVKSSCSFVLHKIYSVFCII